MSQSGLTFLKNEEGVIEGLYDDPSGYCTYGIGHLVHKGSCYLLNAAQDQSDFRSYVKTKWAGTASETPYLDRSVRFASKFDELKKAAAGTGSEASAQGGVNSEANILATAVESLLKLKLPAYEKVVARTIKIDLTQGEFDALVSFTYNIGPEAFAGSTLAGLINGGKFKAADAKARRTAIEQIDAEFKKWRKSAGKVLKGLVARREHEATLFLGDARSQLQELEAKQTPTVGPPRLSKAGFPASPNLGNKPFTPMSPIQPAILPFSYPSNPQAPFCPSYPMLRVGMTKISH
jgi:lysozyme